MSVTETILVFAGAPLAVVLLVALLTMGSAARDRRPRYKPGQSWHHAPVWYEPHPDGAAHGGAHGDGHAALPAGAKPAGPLGGARGTW